MTIRVEMDSGVSIFEAFEQAYQLTCRVRCNIEFSFNGHACVVYTAGNGLESTPYGFGEKVTGLWRREPSGVWKRTDVHADRWETAKEYNERIKTQNALNRKTQQT